jgi:uncharacterized protein DUF3159
MSLDALARRLPPLRLTAGRETSDTEHLAMPSPRATLLHAWPVVLEAVVAPLVLFYLVLVMAGFRGALAAALAWSYLALGRRLATGERVSTLLALGTLLLTVRTVVAFVTGSAFVYFAQPMAATVVIALVLMGSAVIGRPFTQRFAHDFCPIDPEILARPRVRRFFVRISLLWATVLMLNTGIALWLLASSSLRTFVVERTAVTWGITALAVFLSITRFVATMRRDGITVEWSGVRQSLRIEPEVLGIQTGAHRGRRGPSTPANPTRRPSQSPTRPTARTGQGQRAAQRLRPEARVDACSRSAMRPSEVPS